MGSGRVGMRRRLPLVFALCLVSAWGVRSLSQEPPPEESPPAPPQETQPPPTQTAPVGPPEEAPPPEEPEPAPEPQTQTAPAPPPRLLRPRRPLTLRQKHQELVRKMEALQPRGTYVLIDTGTNRLYLMRRKCIRRVAICSTGSGRFLPDPPRNREWTFDTPKGEFRVQRKFVKPVWIKPDWAFIEEGEPLPSRFEERVAPEELGDYAMDLGDGYLIHGTLYERSLGLSVTHGCVRLGAKDLDAIFHSVRIGTPVYIF